MKGPLHHASHKEPEKHVCVKGNRYSWTEARKPLFTVVLEPHIVFATCYEATTKHAARETVLRSSQLLENTPCRHHVETWELAIDRPGITGNSNNLRKKERTNEQHTNCEFYTEKIYKTTERLITTLTINYILSIALYQILLSFLL